MTPSYMRPDQRHGTLATDRKHRPFALLFVLTVTLFVGLPAAALAQSRPQFVDGSVDGNTLTMTFDRALMEDLSGENAEYFPRFYFGVWERKEPVFLPNEPDPAGRIFPVVDGVRVRGNSVTLTLERVVEPMVLVWVYFHNLSINPPIRDLNGVNPGTFVKQVTNRTGLTPPTQPGRPNSLQGKPDDKRATLSWEPPTNTGGTETLTYEWRQGITGTWPSVGTATTVTIPNLENGTNYTFYVQARNSAGAGPAANTTVRPAGRVRRKTSWWSQATSRSGSAGARRPTTTVRPSDATSGSRAAAAPGLRRAPPPPLSPPTSSLWRARFLPVARAVVSR